jgi:alpha-tubulin suppressor-like RCC1 family protein
LITTTTVRTDPSEVFLEVIARGARAACVTALLAATSMAVSDAAVAAPPPTGEAAMRAVAGSSIACSGGELHTLRLRSDGTVWAWGDNTFGQLGDGTTEARCSPIRVRGITSAAMGWSHALASTADGTVFAWGRNKSGQLGDGTTTDRRSPVAVIDSGAIAVSAGEQFSLALDDAGSAWAWGDNKEDQLGLGDRLTRLTPTQIAGTSDLVSIGAGNRHSLAADADGTPGAGAATRPASWATARRRIARSRSRSPSVG